ncbi:TetR family transcriptional regulator [Sulfurimicrobium lacus]|uniref:TetR family transcriptional regulator n=1 Tax=Sulfurimicrobium lacus TaxID=2715678 RepID=A0A6F8V9F9_9PROT|nr:TetR/AcrR family transcriptional regulator [Sulfurimicrobium lacus]BCB25771.1 TetR family transcriptional regulator [Sulfurimicrobium lacus]
MQSKQPDLTRDKVLEAAFCEIHRSGFQAASIANILGSTGLTKGALYHHFPTKQALGLAVVDEVIRPRLESRYYIPLRESEKPLDTLLGFLETMAERADELVLLGCPLNNLMQEMSPIDAEFRGHLCAVMNAWREAMETALRRAQAQGDLRADVNCADTALFIFSAWEGCIGTAKNLQSHEALFVCSRQLQAYIRSLRAT